MNSNPKLLRRGIVELSSEQIMSRRTLGLSIIDQVEYVNCLKLFVTEAVMTYYALVLMLIHRLRFEHILHVSSLFQFSSSLSYDVWLRIVLIHQNGIDRWDAYFGNCNMMSVYNIYA